MIYFAGLFGEAIANVEITMNTGIYTFVNWLYQVYLYIASARLIKNDAIDAMKKRLMVIVGIVMLFIVAFSLLKAIINPEKEIKNTSKIFTTAITSLIMLTLVNTVFNYLYEAQSIILKENVIGKIILGGVDTSSENINLSNAGINMAANTLNAFFSDVRGEEDKSDPYKLYTSEKHWYWFGDNQKVTRAEVIDICMKSETLTAFTMFAAAIDEEEIDFSFFLALVCGLFMIYVFISFCLDMAVRTIKLALLQIIAPIPILARIIPGQENIFNNWIKKTTTAFMEVFIKLAIVFFGIYLIIILGNNINGLEVHEDIITKVGDSVKAAGYIAVVIGILMFIKQAPGYISEIFGINSGNMKLGLKDKLSGMVGAGVVGAAAGAATGYMGGAISSKKNGGSFFRGGLSGAYNGFKGKGNQMKAQATRAYREATGDYKSEINGLGSRTLGQKINDRVKSSDKKNKEIQKQKRDERANIFQQMQSKHDALHNTDVYNQRVENFEKNNEEYNRFFNEAKGNDEVQNQVRLAAINYSKQNPYAKEDDIRKVRMDAQNKFAKEYAQNKLKENIQKNKVDPKTGISYRDSHPDVYQYVNDINVKIDVDEALGDTKNFDNEYNNMKAQVDKDAEISKRLGEEDSRKKAKQTLDEYFKDMGYGPKDKNDN